MESNGAVSTRRIELSDEKWVELRARTNVGDVRYQREERVRRGGVDDEVLDSLALIEHMIVGWSFGSVPSDMSLVRAVIDQMSEPDAVKLANAVRERDDGRPNPSKSSSAGGRKRRT